MVDGRLNGSVIINKDILIQMITDQEFQTERNNNSDTLFKNRQIIKLYYKGFIMKILLTGSDEHYLNLRNTDYHFHCLDTKSGKDIMTCELRCRYCNSFSRFQVLEIV